MMWLIIIVLVVVGGILALECLGLYVIIKAWENIFNDRNRG